MRTLDVGTKAYDSTGRGDVQSTWAGLISSVMVCVTSELEDDKRAVDKNAISLLRQCVAAAEGRKRSTGILLPLLRRAGKLFSHVLNVLRSEDVNFAVEYVNILRGHLLVVPEYCSRAKQSVFEELIELFASKALSSRDASSSGKIEENYRAAAAFHLLLENCPFDLSPNVMDGLLVIFEDFFRNLQEEGRSSAMILSAMNSFLLKTGLDISSRMGALHSSVLSYLTWAFKGNHIRDKRLREELIRYCYIQIRLIVLSTDDVNDLIELIDRQVAEIGTDRSIGSDNAERFNVKLPQRLLFELYGELFVIAKEDRSSKTSVDEDSSRVTKRARGNRKRVEDIIAKAVNSGGCWGAVFCLLMQKHSNKFSSNELILCTKQLVGALQDLFSQGSLSDGKTLSQTVWLIRCLQEIAGVAQDDSSPVWKEVADCITYYLPAHLSEIRLTNECTLLFATMISQGLMHASLLGSNFWTQSIFNFEEVPTVATLELVASVASVAFCDSILAGRSQDDYFHWLLRGLSQKTDERLSFYGRRANVASTWNLALTRVQSAFQNSVIAGSYQCWIKQLDHRLWLELPDGSYASLMRSLDKLQILTEPFAKAKLEHRDIEYNVLEDDKDAVVKEVSTDLEVHRIAILCLQQVLTSAKSAEEALRVCAVALGTMAAVGLAGVRSRAAHAATWGIESPLFASIDTALTDALDYDGMHMLSSRTTILDAIPAIAEALKQIKTMGWPTALQKHSSEIVKVLYNSAMDFVKAIEEALLSSASLAGSSCHSQESNVADVDMDFEMVAADFSQTQRSNTSQMATTSSSRTSEYEVTIVKSEEMIRKVLACAKSMFSVHPGGVTKALAKLLQHSVPPEGAPPRGACGIGISQDIAETVLSFTGQVESQCAIDDVVPVLQAVARGQVNLDENAGLTSSAREWLLVQVTELTRGLCATRASEVNSEMPGNIDETLLDLVSLAAGIADDEVPTGLRNPEARAHLADCIFLLFKYNLDYFQPQFGATLAWLLNDPSYLVRIHAGVALASVLDFYEEADHMSIFQNTVVPGLAMKCRFLPTGDLEMAPTADAFDTEKEWSSLYIIAAVGIVSRVLEPWCAYIIIHHRARREKGMQTPAINAIGYLAEGTGHRSLQSFVTYHLKTIGKLWIDGEMPLSLIFEVPEFLGMPRDASKKEVALCLKRSLLPPLIYQQAHNSLKELSVACEMSTSEILRSEWEAVYARLYALSGNSNPDRKAVDALKFASSLVKTSNGNRSADLASTRVKVVTELLLLARCPVERAKLFDVPPPYSQSRDIVGIVESFVKESKIDWGADIIFECMLRIHEALDSATSARHKSKTLSSLSVLLSCIGEQVQIPAVFRYVHFMLIPSLSDHIIGTQCMGILQNLCLSAYESLSHLDGAQSELSLAMENLVTPLAFVLSSVVLETSSQALKSEALKFLTTITHNPPECLLQALSVQPDLPEFEECRDPIYTEAMVDLGCNYASPDKKLASLVELVPTLPKSLRRSVLRAGGREALVFRESLERMCEEDESSPIPEKIWIFTELCAEIGDAELFAIAAELLSTLGPLRPYAIAFQTPKLNSGKDKKSDCTTVVLRYLSGLLCSPKSATVRASAEAIQDLLSLGSVASKFEGMTPAEKAFLAPFMKKSRDQTSLQRKEASLMVADTYGLDDERLWRIGPNTSFKDWICTLTHRLLKECRSNPMFDILAPLVHADASLAELVLPHAFLEISDGDMTPSRKTLREQSSRGVAMCLSNASTLEEKRAAKTILSALERLRWKRVSAFRDRGKQAGAAKLEKLSKTNKSPTHWAKVYWFEVDYLIAARAAIETHAPLTAILLVEHWLEEQSGTVSLDESDLHGEMTDDVPSHLQILLQAQSKISEPDGLYGLLHSNSLELQLHVSEEEGHWYRSLAGYDLLRSDIGGGGKVQSSNFAMLKALRQLGCLHLLRTYSKALTDDELCAPELKDLQYEAAWRAGQWTLPTALMRTQTLSAPKFNQNLHSSLRALERGDGDYASYEADRSRAELLKQLINDGTESADAMNVAIMRMRMLDDVSAAARLWRHFGSENQTRRDNAITSLKSSWKFRHVVDAPFKLIEPSLAIQGVILRLAALHENFAQHMTRTSILARKAGNLTEGVQAMRKLRIMASCPSSPGTKPLPDLILSRTSPWRVEEAKLLWAEGKSESAIAVVHSMLQLMNDGKKLYHARQGAEHVLTTTMKTPDPRFFELLCLLAKWQASARTESSIVLYQKFSDCIDGLNEFYKLTLSQSKTRKEANTVVYSKDGVTDVTQLRLLSRCHYRLAQFADSQYRQLEERFNSPEWARSERLRRTNETELITVRNEKEKKRIELASKKKGSKAHENLAREIRGLQARFVPLEMQVKNDKQEFDERTAAHAHALIRTLQGYRRSLDAGGWNSQASVFRCIALWFTHCGQQDGAVTTMRQKIIDQVNEEIIKLTTRRTIPSYIFLDLSHQIVSRLGTTSDGDNKFGAVLEALVMRLMRDHPHHVLHQLHALSRGNRASRYGVHSSTAKVEAAAKLLKKFSSDSNARKSLVGDMNRLIEAYISIAQLKLSRDDAVLYHNLPNAVKKRSLSNLTSVPVPTAHIEIDPKCKYPDGSFPSFMHFQETTRLVGGINEPKLVKCHGSDGKIYLQLAKSGNDDLRQDAVIQQFFGLVNTLLKQNMSTNSRNMRIRTYKVIPFSPEAGLLEWVDETILLSTYLIHARACAHERYRPQDMKHAQASEMMRNSTPDTLHKDYAEVCENFRPVMHNFFTEHYREPAEWFERRVSYIRSCAVNSMVGYVIGLGDRHSSNIMIDRWTAEFVHIDFGVTFEQGLTLKTPERVPFRLTRDIVDGMGACGVEGIMRRCCEETMEVLRANKDALTTVIAVLVHDPILKWSVNAGRQAAARAAEIDRDPLTALFARKPDVNDGNLDAERALMRVKQKLDGYEDGELRSIKGQVRQLLHDARDPFKLAAMYPGWAPWV